MRRYCPGVVSARAACGADDQHLRVADGLSSGPVGHSACDDAGRCACAVTAGTANATAATRIRRSIRSIVSSSFSSCADCPGDFEVQNAS